MGEQKPEELALCGMAKQLEDIYREFTDSVKALGSKSKDGKRSRSTKMGSSIAHWVGGSHVTTDRETLCEKFLADVKGQLEMLLLAAEYASREEAADAAALAVDIMSEPRPPKSDSTTDLMKRAMIGQAKPLFPYLRPEKRREVAERLKKAYSRWHRLPVETEVIRELERLNG
ncbi:MAG TPA: hypothetical protein IAC80_06635 [Candidatus Merdiplasma excrementigallinarum]|uniref:Uncharacterized protein n=1 Tax=Candidatus Merdiplasma excrementigallinarum TaxID=2840864 RepID=A0A9D1P0K8_9FIRM|nr:hypothetical protein [Candidatus Merdiplasma excrementigallinarum]